MILRTMNQKMEFMLSVFSWRVRDGTEKGKFISVLRSLMKSHDGLNMSGRIFAQWRRGSTVFGGAKGSNFPTTRQFFKTNSSDPPFNFMFFKVS